MATCKDCLHYDMCSGFTPTDLDRDVFDYCRKGITDEIPDIDERCSNFEDKSRFVYLPCNVGELVYVIKYCRCANPDAFTVKHCHHKITHNTPIVYASVMLQQYGYKVISNFGEIKRERRPIGTICYRVIKKPFDISMIAEVGKTVFVTLEQAETALSERAADYGRKQN